MKQINLIDPAEEITRLRQQVADLQRKVSDLAETLTYEQNMHSELDRTVAEQTKVIEAVRVWKKDDDGFGETDLLIALDAYDAFRQHEEKQRLPDRLATGPDRTSKSKP